jgi:phosphoglycolate phosphatase
LTIRIVKHLLTDVPFIVIAGATAEMPKKPDPAGALLVAGKMNIVPDQIIYVGDSDVDMITAKSALMLSVGVSWGFRSIEELLANGAKIILEKPGDLLQLLR